MPDPIAPSIEQRIHPQKERFNVILSSASCKFQEWQLLAEAREKMF